ncbi:MAG: hypothetical protein WA705_18450 [Candidatus Ozemobacteraceae bacterium]
MRFRFIDRIKRWEAFRTLEGAKAVSFEEYELKAPFGDAPELPRSLVVEVLYQAANWLTVLSSDYSSGSLLVDTGRVQFFTSLHPGERLDVVVSFDADAIIDGNSRANADMRGDDRKEVSFHGSGRVGTREVVRLEDAFMRLIPLSELDDPEDVRVLFSEISPKS